MFDTCHPRMKAEHIAEAVVDERPDVIALSFLSTTSCPATRSMARRPRRSGTYFCPDCDSFQCCSKQNPESTGNVSIFATEYTKALIKCLLFQEILRNIFYSEKNDNRTKHQFDKLLGNELLEACAKIDPDKSTYAEHNPQEPIRRGHDTCFCRHYTVKRYSQNRCDKSTQ